MPITYDWYIKNHVVKVDFYDAIRIEDIAELSDNLIALFESIPPESTARIHVIVDEANVTDPPKKVWDVVNNLTFATHSKMGWLLLYGNQEPFIKFLSQMVTRIVGVKYRYLPDFETALMHLETADVSIRWE